MKNNYLNLKIIFLITIGFLIVFSIPATSENTYAQTNEDLDNVIDGFEDEEPENDSKSNENKNEIDDAIDGFDDDESGSSDTLSKAEEPSLLYSIFSLDGYLKVGSSYAFSHDKPESGQTDWRGLNRLQTETRLELSAKFSDSYQFLISGNAFYDFAYSIKGRDEFNDDVLESQEKEYELRDTYFLITPIESLDIKGGRQIVVWGRSDNIRINDVLNPMDMREPGITDIENLRLPVAMMRIDYYIGDWSITGIAIPEIRFNKIPEFGSEFDAISKIIPIPKKPEEDIPEDGYKNMEYGASINGIFSKWDISFYWADFYRDFPHVEFTNSGFRMKHARLTMYGTAFNVALGNWLVKSEAAYFDGFQYFNTPDKTFSKIDFMAGIEYTGFTDTMIAIEGYNSHTLEYDDDLKKLPDFLNENVKQAALRITRSFINDTLDIIILVMTMGDSGLVQRYSAEYDIIDALSVSGGVVLYKSDDEEGQYSSIGENDRAFLELKYSF